MTEKTKIVDSKVAKVNKALNPKYECSFKAVVQGKNVCSDPAIVEQIKKYLQSVGDNHINWSSSEKVIEAAKKKTGCDTELCVLESSEVSPFLDKASVEANKEQNFKQVGPANSEAWFSNINIDGILADLQSAFPETKFYHIPFQMRDFKKQAPHPNAPRHMKDANLETLDIPQKYRSGFRTFGVVLNTDYSSGNGIHWYALFVDMRDINNITIEYFNSSGNPPLTETAAWLKKTLLLLEKEFPNSNVKQVIASTHEHQKDEHSCGAYSTFYIISRVLGISYDYFAQNLATDSVMHKVRAGFFIDQGS